ncbi:MAG: hypothetical protein P9L94_10515 [Candidatus Hinthialibacter antarcticus]|nr:hypothetical protein [Candidatus Hinthialibacter antarcticus]
MIQGNQAHLGFINRRQALFGVASALLGAGCNTVSKKKPEDDHELDAAPPPFEMGLSYHYDHVGPRPFGEGDRDCTGGRVVSVLGRDPDYQNLWVVQDRFECEQGIEIGLYDDKYRRHRQGLTSAAGVIQIEEKPPAPIRYLELKKKDKKTFETEQVFMTAAGEVVGAAHMTENVERRFDYRIINPIGAILCRYFIVDVSIEADLNGAPVTVAAKVESYWSDKLHWFVQMEYEFKPMQRGGKAVGPAYRAKSVLKDIQEAEA